MPVVGGGNDYSVHVLVVQQLAIVLVLFGRGAGFAYGKIHVLVAQIADGGGFLIGPFEKSVMHLIAPVADTDISYADPVVSAENMRVAQRRGARRHKCPS